MEHVVLLVDDDKNVIHGLTRSLRQQPYRLYTAESGDEAIRILKSQNVDVIVTDEKMPGMSGCDLIAWVAKNYPDVVRILLTGHTTAEIAVRAINDGAVYHFFTKPCRDTHLIIAIDKAVEQRERLKETIRLREFRQHEIVILELLDGDLENLMQVVLHDLQVSLRNLSRSCEEGREEALGPLAKALLDRSLDASAEVERLVADLLASVRAQGLTRPANQSGSGGKHVALLPNAPPSMASPHIQPAPAPDQII